MPHCAPPTETATARSEQPRGRGWAGDSQRTAAREKTRREAERLFSKRMLTDDIHFHHRIDSRSQMSRSGKYRAVLGTSWRSWRGRWSVLLPLWILGGVMRVRGDARRGWNGTEVGGGSVTRRGEDRKKNKWHFSLATATLDPRHSFLSSATSTTAWPWDAGGRNLGLGLHQGALNHTPPSLVCSPLPLSNQQGSDDQLRVAVHEIPSSVSSTPQTKERSYDPS